MADELIKRGDGAYFERFDAGRPIWTFNPYEGMLRSECSELMIGVIESYACVEIVEAPHDY